MIVLKALLAPIGQSGISSDMVAVVGSNPAWGASTVQHGLRNVHIKAGVTIGERPDQ